MKRSTLTLTLTLTLIVILSLSAPIQAGELSISPELSTGCRSQDENPGRAFLGAGLRGIGEGPFGFKIGGGVEVPADLEEHEESYSAFVEGEGLLQLNDYLAIGGGVRLSQDLGREIVESNSRLTDQSELSVEPFARLLFRPHESSRIAFQAEVSQAYRDSVREEGLGAALGVSFRVGKPPIVALPPVVAPLVPGSTKGTCCQGTTPTGGGDCSTTPTLQKCKGVVFWDASSSCKKEYVVGDEGFVWFCEPKR